LWERSPEPSQDQRSLGQVAIAFPVRTRPSVNMDQFQREGRLRLERPPHAYADPTTTITAANTAATPTTNTPTMLALPCKRERTAATPARADARVSPATGQPRPARGLDRAGHLSRGERA
jgi:hypothetical protein